MTARVIPTIDGLARSRSLGMTARVIPTIDGLACSRSQRHRYQDERSDVHSAYSRDDPCGHPVAKWRSSCGQMAVILQRSGTCTLQKMTPIPYRATRVPGVNYVLRPQSCY